MRIAGHNNKLYKNIKLVDLTGSPTAAVTCSPVSSGFSSSVTSTSATLSWASSSNAFQYEVRYKRVSDTTWTSILTPSLNITINNLQAGTNYEWQVKADCSSIASGWSITQSFTTAVVPPSSLTAGFYRNARTVDYIKATDFPIGHMTEAIVAQNSNYKSAKFFCEPTHPRLFSVNYTTPHSGTSRWIKIVDPPGTCAGGNPWLARIQMYRNTSETSSNIPVITPTEEFFMDVTYYFPNTTLIDPPEPDFVASTGFKISPSVTGTTGVGVTKGNPQTTGKFEVIFHAYGMQNNKKDYRNSTYTKTNSLTDFHLGASIYAADSRTAGDGYQHDIFFCNAGGTTRKVFTVGKEYRFRGYIRTNTPKASGPYDGMLYWQLSTDGGAWEDLVSVTDWNWRGNFTTPLGQSGWILFRGGSYGWLVGYASNYPTTIHETNIYMKSYMNGTFPLGNNDPTGDATIRSNMFSFIPSDSIPQSQITNVKWDIKNASSGAVLYTANGAPDGVSKTGNFWHGRWNWPIINLDPAFVSTSNGPVQVCKTITDTNGNISNPFCITYSKGVYDDNNLVPVSCPAPTNLAATVNGSSVTLTWSGTNNSYEIIYKPVNSNTYITNTSSTNTITLQNLLSNTQYEWQVRSVCTPSFSTYSNGTFITQGQNSCTAPSIPVVSNITNNSAQVTYTYSGLSVNVEYRQQGSTNWITSNTTSNTFLISGLLSSTTYELRINTVCSGSLSAYTAVITFTTLGAVNSSDGNVLLYTNSTTLTAAETVISNILTSAGLTVATSTTLDEHDQYDAIIVGPSRTSVDVKWISNNIVFMNTQGVVNALYAKSVGSSSQAMVYTQSHSITSGLSGVITNSAQSLNVYNQLAPGAIQLGTSNGNTCLAIIENGGARYEDWALGRIVLSPFNTAVLTNLNTAGQTLLLNIVQWALAGKRYNEQAPYLSTVNSIYSGSFSVNSDLFVTTSQIDEEETLANVYGIYPIGYAAAHANFNFTFNREHVLKLANSNNFSNYAFRSYNNNPIKILVYGDAAIKTLVDNYLPTLYQTTKFEYVVELITSIPKIDSDTVLLILPDVQTKFSSIERTNIENYISRGGSIFSIGDTGKLYPRSTTTTTINNIPGIAKDAEIITIHFDGDTQDDDDICAMNICTLLIAAAGLAPITHFFYGNNLNEGDTAWQVVAMRKSAEFAEAMGIKTYDYTADTTGSNFGLNAFSNVRAQFVALTSSGKKVLCIEAGPMEAIYRVLNDTPTIYHPNLTLVSHSTWNENRNVLNAPGAVAARKWTDCKADFPLCTYIDIDDQNNGFYTTSWAWMDSSTNPVIKEARLKMLNAGEKEPAKINDASDAGMVWYALTGQEDGNALDVEAYLSNKVLKFADKFTEVQPGLLMYQLEDVTNIYSNLSSKGWAVETQLTGYSGTGYLNFVGPNQYQAENAAYRLEIPFEVTTQGTYEIVINSRNGHATDPSQKNDTWINIPTATDFYAFKNGNKIYAKGNPYGQTNVTLVNDSSNGFLKYYINVLGAWGLQTSAVDNNQHVIRAELAPGTHTFQISGRSNGHSTDAIFIRSLNLTNASITPYVQPPSNTTSTTVTTGGEWDQFSELITGVVIQSEESKTSNVKLSSTPGDFEKQMLSLNTQYATSGGSTTYSISDDYPIYSYKSNSFIPVVNFDQEPLFHYYLNGKSLMTYIWKLVDTDILNNVINLSMLKARFSNYTKSQPVTKINTISNTGTVYYVSGTGTGSGTSSSTPMSYAACQALLDGGPLHATFLFNKAVEVNNLNLTINNGGVSSSQLLKFGSYGTGDIVKFTDGSFPGSVAIGTETSPNIFQMNYLVSYKTFSIYIKELGKHIYPSRTAYRYASGGSASSITDPTLASQLPGLYASMTSNPSRYRVYWKADLYTWEWDTVSSVVGNTINFASGSHTTSPSTQYPYYIENVDFVYADPDQDWAFLPGSSLGTIKVPNNLDPTQYSYTYITDLTLPSRLVINAGNVEFNNFRFYGGINNVYISGGLSDISFKGCLFEGAYGAAIYNEHDSRFTVDNCMFHGISGVGVYLNSASYCEIKNSIMTEVGLEGGKIYGVNSTPGRAQNQFHSGITMFGKTTGGSSYNIIDNNIIMNIGYNGIRFDGDYNAVTNNIIVSTMLELSDGGGIYAFGGNTSAYTNGSNIANNIIIYTPGNLKATPKNPDRNLAEGIYLDNGCSGVTVSDNVIYDSGGWAALNNFDNIACIWEDNVMAKSYRYGLLTFDQTTSGNNDDHELSNNTFLVTHPDHSPIVALKRNAPPGYIPVVASDFNKFVNLYNQRPEHENVSAEGRTYSEWVAYGTRYHKNLATWQTSGFDASSTEFLFDKTYKTKYDDDVLIFVNIGTSTSLLRVLYPLVDLNSTYTTVTGTSVDINTVNIPGKQALILIKN